MKRCHLYCKNCGILVAAHLFGASTDGDTVWSDGFDPVAAGVIFKASN
jgi:hypothetical protein